MSVRKHSMHESEKPTLIDLNGKGALLICVSGKSSSISMRSYVLCCPPCVNFVFRSAFLIITKWPPIAMRTLHFTFHIQRGRECHFSGHWTKALNFALRRPFLHLFLQQGREWVFPSDLDQSEPPPPRPWGCYTWGRWDGCWWAITMSISSCFWAGWY